MTGRQGFTLLEIMVVLVIIGVLLRLATLSFNSFQVRNGIGGEISTIRNDLMAVRASAMYQHRDQRVKLASNSFQVYSSLTDTVAPIIKKNLSYAISYSNATIDFDPQGYYGAASGTDTSICVGNSGNQAAVDSLVVLTARIHVGKRVTGGGCTSASINVE